MKFILSEIMSIFISDNITIIDDRDHSNLPVIVNGIRIGVISYDEKEWGFLCTYIGNYNVNRKTLNIILKKIDELNKEEKHE